MFVNSKTGNIKDMYHFDKNIGHGSFGVVYLARDRFTLQKVAIKVIEIASLKNISQFINEVNILSQLDHPNIVKIKEIWEWDKLFFMVTDYYEGGELYHYCNKRGYLEEYEAFKVVKQMASILLYLEEQNISHRDLKLENFLLKDPDDLTNIKLIDFGLSKTLSVNFKSQASGTPYYVAPETLLEQSTIKSDIWSLGVITYCLLSGTVPFFGNNN